MQFTVSIIAAEDSSCSAPIVQLPFLGAPLSSVSCSSNLRWQFPSRGYLGQSTVHATSVVSIVFWFRASQPKSNASSSSLAWQRGRLPSSSHAHAINQRRALYQDQFRLDSWFLSHAFFIQGCSGPVQVRVLFFTVRVVPYGPALTFPVRSGPLR